MSQQIVRATYAEMVWFHEVPQDAFDLLPCKVSETGSKRLKVRGMELVFFRVGHGVCPDCGGSGGGPQGPGQPDQPKCPTCTRGKGEAKE